MKRSIQEVVSESAANQINENKIVAAVNFETLCLYLSRYFQEDDMFNDAVKHGYVNWDEIDSYKAKGIDSFDKNELMKGLMSHDGDKSSEVWDAANNFAKAAIDLYKLIKKGQKVN